MFDLESLFKSLVDTANEGVWETPEKFPWLVGLLLIAGIFITFRMGWINVRYFMHAINVIRGKYDNPDDDGDINHFQALTTALSATVGIGNIAGVATAIHYGGPGVIFWLWVSGIFGMTLKYAECTLSMHFRTFDKKGNAAGGPMYYIERGLGKNWKWMAIAFALLAIVCSFGSGNMNQANTVAVSADADFNIPDWIVGLFLALVVGSVIIGGIKRIGAVTSRLMPFMAIIYTLGAMTILVANAELLPGLVSRIVTEAFNPTASYAGAAAGLWHLTLLWGVKRALFSNEAGQGSAPIAHAAAKTKEPVREGAVAMVGPFIDTLTICTLTGLVILCAGVWDDKKDDEFELDLDKIDAYVCPAEGEPAVTDADIHLEIPELDENGNPVLDEDGEPVLVDKIEEFEGTVSVENGYAPGVLFAINDGFIEEARLYSDGKPYSGPFTIAREEFEFGPLTMDKVSLSGAEGESLHLDVKGRAFQNSSALTAFAFRECFERSFGWGEFGNIIVTICVFLFGISTMISWSYYGDRCVVYLFGVQYVMIYRIIYVCFSFLGATLALETVWAYGDLALGLMSVPNLIAVLLLSPVLVKLSKDYFSREHKTYK